MTERAGRAGRDWRGGRFFAVHYDLHAVASDVGLGRDLTAEHLRAELKRLKPDWVQCDAKGCPGFTSYPTKVGTPAPGIEADALRVHRDVTAELGLPLVVHYSGLWDTQATEAHPEWAVVDADGRRNPKRICPMSDYRDERMIPQLLELAVDYGVDGIWVDAENWVSAPCWCERCAAAFGREPPRGEDDPGWHDWLAFQRANVVAHISAYCDAVHAAAPDCAVTSNWLAATSQPEDVEPDVDWLSGDTAPGIVPVVDARILDGRGLPWELMTWAFVTPYPGHPITDLKPVAHLRQEVAISMACGGGVVLYDLPERTGRLTGWRQQVLADVGAWARQRREVVQSTASVPQVAVLHSERNHYRNSPPLFLSGPGDQPLRGAVHALLDAHYSVDVINESDLARRGREYPLIVVPEQADLSDDAAAELEQYVRNGGRALVTGARAAAVMPGLVGADPAGSPVEGYSLLASRGASIRMTGPWQPVAPTTAKAVAYLLASPEADDATDQAVITVHDVGQGRVVAVHGPLFAHHAQYHAPLCRDLVADLCDLAGPALAVEVDGPHRVHVALRAKGADTVLHVVNMGGRHPLAPATVHIDAVPPTGPVTVRVRTAKRPARVRLVPAGSQVAAVSADGWTSVTLPDVDVHAALVFEGSV